MQERTGIKGNPFGRSTDAGFEVILELPAGGLPARVIVSPAVWLCCVYPALRREDRMDRQQEAARMDKLLQAVADAWLNHTRTAGSLAHQCVFAYSADDQGRYATSVPIRIEVTGDDPDQRFTRLELAA